MPLPTSPAHIRVTGLFFIAGRCCSFLAEQADNGKMRSMHPGASMNSKLAVTQRYLVHEGHARLIWSEMNQRKLLAVVSVDHKKRVRCQHPGCTQTIYSEVHVISDGGTLKVIGSTCIKKGDYGDLGKAAFTGGPGSGKTLSDEERELLANNTAELVRKLEAQYNARILAQEQLEAQAAAAQAAKKEAQRAKFLAIKQMLAEQSLRRPAGPVVNPGSALRSQTIPWAWVDPMRSMLYLKMQDGSHWLRVQARVSDGGKHHLVPFPVFDGWDEYLPPKFGHPNTASDGYELTDLIGAISFMRSLKPVSEVVCAGFSNVLEHSGR